MKQNNFFKDNDSIGLYVVTILTFILNGIIFCLERNYAIPFIGWLLYAIYVSIHIEIQDNHNKLINYLNDKNKEKDETK